MTPYLQGQEAYFIDRFTYEMNPFLKDCEKLSFDSWPHDAQEWYFGWRDAAIGVNKNEL